MGLSERIGKSLDNSYVGFNIKLLEGLCVYMMRLDSMRSPVSLGVTQNSFSMLLFFLFNGNKQTFFVKNRPDIDKKIKEILDSFYKDALNSSNDDSRFESIVFLIVMIFVIFLSSLALFVFDLSLFNLLFLGFFLTVVFFYLYLVWASTRGRRTLAKKHDADLKIAVQLLIDHGIVLIRENDLNPVDFPIRLRHDDYSGLVYEKKGKNKFVGVFKK